MRKAIKNFDILVIGVAMLLGLFMSRATVAEGMKGQASLYDISANSITGKPLQMSDFKGKVALVVNTASKCGFTSQYKGLEELYQKHKDKDFVVLGFPSNDFGKQEPGTNEDIASFCKVNFGVTFPLFEKAPVTGETKQEAFKVLTEKSASQLRGDPGWNFVKFLVDKNGIPRARFSSMTSPQSSSIEAEIEKLLSE